MYCNDQSVQYIDVLVTYLLETEKGRKFTCQNCFVNVCNDSNLLRLRSSINVSSVTVVRCVWVLCCKATGTLHVECKVM